MMTQACVSVDVNPFMECEIFTMNVWTMTISFDSFQVVFAFDFALSCISIIFDSTLILLRHNNDNIFRYRFTFMTTRQCFEKYNPT